MKEVNQDGTILLGMVKKVIVLNETKKLVIDLQDVSTEVLNLISSQVGKEVQINIPK